MEAAALDALLIAAEEAEKNPTPQILLKQEIAERETRNDWPGVESLYHKVLALEEATDNHALITKAHLDLSRLFFLLGDLDRAEASAKAATTAARSSGIGVLLCMTLENQVRCALCRAEVAIALELASESVALTETDGILAGQRAAAWVTRAECRLFNGDVAGAESDLLAARPELIDKPISPLFAGLHNRVAKWWEVMGQLRAQQSDLAGACDAWKQAVKTRRHITSLPQVAGPYTLAALARALSHLSRALASAGDDNGSETASTEAPQIWSGMGLPQPRMPED